MLEKEFNWYLEHQNELVKQYNGKYLVIAGGVVVYDSSNKDEAYSKGVELLGLGNFILQLCTPGAEAYTMTFHTHRVHFSPFVHA